MNPLNTLYFPETEPAPGATGGLLLFFNRIFSYLPTENQTEAQNTLPAQEQLVTAYAPAPLGPDLDRFNRLIKDMNLHQEEFLGQLSILLSDTQRSNQTEKYSEMSTNSLIAALTGKKDSADPAPDEALWQARLLLKLAEKIDRLEQEARTELDTIDTLQEKMLTDLQGETDEEAETEDFALLHGQTNSFYFSRSLARLRTLAWSRLFLADQSPERPWLLATANLEASSLLLDNYETFTKKTPLPLFTVPLPDAPDMKDIAGFIQTRTAFRKETAAILDFFNGILSETGAGRNPALVASALEQETAYWIAALERNAQWTCSGNNRLAFHALPGISMPELLAKSFRLPHDRSGKISHPCAVLATLTC